MAYYKTSNQKSLLSYIEDQPALMGLSLPVANEADLGLEPLGAFHTIMQAQAGEILDRSGLLELAQVLR